ncbi:SRPBCC family protein [Ilumatobacter sp.]|uniref:SRPBCC family protein n=1 Tax=Ilumatobacter sp. TaxID=1967498 RepID=UPI003C4D59ED
MVTIERTAVVPASPGDVWAVLAEFGDISRWATNVDHSCLLSEQTEGIGTTRRIQTSRATVVETVEAWEPASSVAYRITGLPRVVRSVTNTWRLVDDGAQTTVSLTTEVDAGPRPPQQLIAKAVGKRLASASDQMLDGLTRHVGTPGATVAVPANATGAPA